LLLGPASSGGSGEVVLCAYDPLTGEDHRDKVVSAPADAVLIVDSVFAFRPEYNAFWGLPDLARRGRPTVPEPGHLPGHGYGGS
jgi:hypothetical protein